MSYLRLTAGLPDFSKAVISLWFRAPSVSVIAASKHSIESQVEGFPMMQTVLPLVTFGAPQVNLNYETRSHNVASWMSPVGDSPPPWYEDYYIQGEPYDVDPSFIGLQCFADGQFRLQFNIQLAAHMDLFSTNYITTVMKIWTGDDPDAPTDTSPGSGYVEMGVNVGQAVKEEVSYINNAQPEFFLVEASEMLAPDTWHHLLLSFDVGGSISIGHPFASSTCRLWYAIDDVDYRGADNLQPYRWIEGSQWGLDDLDDNAILTRNAYNLSGVDTADPNSYLYQNQRIPLPYGGLDNASIPAGAELGLPAAAKYVDGIFRVEMAEFQMWSDVTLDTGIESNRRAFVDAHGVPVDPTGTENDPRGPGEKLLGKPPEILLHGSDDWVNGINTGSLGTAGQFTSVARIEPYTPEPSLEPPTA